MSSSISDCAEDNYNRNLLEEVAEKLKDLVASDSNVTDEDSLPKRSRVKPQPEEPVEWSWSEPDYFNDVANSMGFECSEAYFADADRLPASAILAPWTLTVCEKRMTFMLEATKSYAKRMNEFLEILVNGENLILHEECGDMRYFGNPRLDVNEGFEFESYDNTLLQLPRIGMGEGRQISWISFRVTDLENELYILSKFVKVQFDINHNACPTQLVCRMLFKQHPNVLVVYKGDDPTAEDVDPLSLSLMKCHLALEGVEQVILKSYKITLERI